MLSRHKLACLILNHFVLLAISICFIGCSEANNDVNNNGDDEGINGDNNGNAKNVPPGNPILSLVASGTNLYMMAIEYGVFCSENAGDSWKRIELVAPSTLAISETALYSAYSHIYRWTGEGDAWTKIAPAPRGQHGRLSTIDVLLASGTHLYAGRHDGNLYRVEDEARWVHLNTEWANEPICAVALSGKTICVGTVRDGIFRSMDEGTSWTQVNNGLSAPVYALIESGTMLYAGTPKKGIFRSENHGLSWTQMGLSGSSVYTLAVSGTTLYAGTWKDGIFRSEDEGHSWTQIGLFDSPITSLAVSGTAIYVGTYKDGIFRSRDEGGSWVPINTGIEHVRL